jgi:hypothetical protein
MIYLAAHRQNISVDPKIFEEFCNLIGPMGIKISPWVNAKMKEFIADQKELAEIKKNRNK